MKDFHAVVHHVSLRSMPTNRIPREFEATARVAVCGRQTTRTVVLIGDGGADPAYACKALREAADRFGDHWGTAAGDTVGVEYCPRPTDIRRVGCGFQLEHGTVSIEVEGPGDFSGDEAVQAVLAVAMAIERLAPASARCPSAAS